MDADLWFTLYELALRGANDKSLILSSSELANWLKTSQQTAARRLKDLEERGYLTREISAAGQKVRITQIGIDSLRIIHESLTKIFEAKEAGVLVIQGEVIAGLGEGAYYMQQEGYRKQFTEKLGFSPFTGTLNIRLKTEEDIRIRHQLDRISGIKINGFVSGERTFGSVKCFKTLVENQVEGAVVLPERSHYNYNMIEVIAPINLREKLGLKTGSVVTLKVRV